MDYEIHQTSLARNRGLVSWFNPSSLRKIAISLALFDFLTIFIYVFFVHNYFLKTQQSLAEIVGASTLLFFPLGVIFYIFELYKPDEKPAGLVNFWRTLVAVGFYSVNIFILSYLKFFLDHFWGLYFLKHLLFKAGFSLTLFIVLSLVRHILQLKFHKLVLQTSWMVIGSGKNLEEFLQDFDKSNSGKNLIIASLSDEEESILSNSCFNKIKITQIPFDSIVKLLEHQAVNGVILVSGDRLKREELALLMRIRFSGIPVYTMNQFYESYWMKLPIPNLHANWLTFSQGFTLIHNPIGMQIKRLFDIVVASLLLVMTAPLFLLLILLIKLTCRGNVFFVQQRVGLNGSVFKLYKFRTMIVGADKMGIYTLPSDKRVTRIGNILRKLRLDELPQLWNVLKGEMSIIGPRAEWTECVKDYIDKIPFYNMRHIIKPGITGWAQIRYPYGASVEDALQKLSFDLYYVKNYSFFLDIAILFKTVRTVILGKGR